MKRSKLFKADYAVSFLSVSTTALIATWSEMIFAVLLLLGLFSRLSALVLLAISTLVTIYYPPLEAEPGHAHLLIHCYWSLLALVIICHGPGVISLDKLFCWLRRKKK